MAQCPMETQYLLKFCQALINSELNKSITQYIFEELRKDPNKGDVTEILQVIGDRSINDLSSRQHTGNRHNLLRVRDEAGSARGNGGLEGTLKTKSRTKWIRREFFFFL